MPRSSLSAYIDTRQSEIDSAIRLRRAFKPELRRLRSLPAGNLHRHWWASDILCLEYRVTLLDMRESARYLDKFTLVAPLESITSEDNSATGTRTFRTEILKGEDKLFLTLVVSIPDSDSADASRAKCRKVQIGVDTHTHTSTTPRYQLICD